MFKCKECGTEYETKPDYCDCGNDTFDEILPPEPIENEKTFVTKKDGMWIENNGYGYPINEATQKDFEQEYKTEVIKETVKKSTSTLKPYAIITFAVCIILSLMIILFAFNPKNTEEQATEAKTETTVSQNLPSIEKIWNNSTEGISAYQNNGKKETVTEQQTQTKQNEIKEDNSKKKVEVKNQPLKQEVKKVSNSVSKITNNSSKKVVQTTQNVKTQAISTTVQSVPKSNPQELANYKIKLRNYIASKIAFTTVVGDGECSFSFKVSSSGVLTNKAPANLSDNDSLNEAVYNALRQVYSYAAPPAGYKNETLKLIVRMYNNSFEVYLK